MTDPVLYTSLVWITCAAVTSLIAMARRSGAIAVWALGNAAGGLALLSFTYRPLLPLNLSVAATNFGFLIGPLLLTAALRTVAGRTTPVYWGLGLVGCVTVVNLLIGPGLDTLAARSAIGLAASAILALPLMPLLREPRWALRTVAILLVVMIALRIGRFFLVITVAGGDPQAAITHDGLFALGVGLLVVAANVSFLWLLAVDAAERHAAAQSALLAELAIARDQALAASRAKSSFLANLSHELRTPLNAILGFAQLLVSDRAPPLAAAQADWAREIESSGRHLLRLMNDLLDLAAIEAGRVTLEPRSVPLDPVFASLARGFAPQAAAAGIRLQHGPTPLGVQADPDRVRQILANLISNAVKYTPAAGTVTIAAEPAPGGRVRISVSDTGPGVPEARLPELFQPFSRLGAETTGVAGTGLGLSIVRQLARAMEGEAGYTPRPGGGSDFWVLLPANTATGAMRGVATPPVTSLPADAV